MQLDEIIDHIGVEPYYREDAGVIYCADCLDILPKMPDKCVDLVVTDPPYGVGIKYGNSFVDTMSNWQNLTLDWLPVAISKSQYGILFTPGGLEQEAFLYQRCPPKWRICWHKGAQSQRSPIGFKHWENVFVYGNTRSQCPDYFYANPGDTDNGNTHPVSKPIKWAEWLIVNFSIDNSFILDPFLGNGTTAVAAKQLGRKFIGIEINESYCRIAVQRLAQEILI